jgi:hypothetical protein
MHSIILWPVVSSRTLPELFSISAPQGKQRFLKEMLRLFVGSLRNAKVCSENKETTCNGIVEPDILVGVTAFDIIVSLFFCGKSLQTRPIAQHTKKKPSLIITGSSSLGHKSQVSPSNAFT